MSISASALQDFSSARDTKTDVRLHESSLIGNVYEFRLRQKKEMWRRTGDVLLKYHFGSLQKVLSDDKHLLTSSYRAAVQTLFQDLGYSCRLSWRNKTKRLLAQTVPE